MALDPNPQSARNARNVEGRINPRMCLQPKMLNVASVLERDTYAAMCYRKVEKPGGP